MITHDYIENTLHPMDTLSGIYNVLSDSLSKMFVMVTQRVGGKWGSYAY